MGTRACIARLVGEMEFAGRYHHWDGYPQGLGKTLFELYNGHFKRDLKAMLKYLLDDHPAGWSTINGADFNKAAGFSGRGPQCYCHGSRNEAENLISELDASDCGCEWVYAFDVKTNHMHVLSSHWTKGGGKMIGMFGHGGDANDVTWKPVAAVDLNGAAPSWESIGQ